MYAPNLQGYTINGSFRSTWSWGWFCVYFLHQPHLRCLTDPTGLQVLRLSGLMTPTHRLYAICLHFVLPTAQLSPFRLCCQIGVQTVHPLDKKGVGCELYSPWIGLLSPAMQQQAR
jgi:hypothetical protein